MPKAPTLKLSLLGGLDIRLDDILVTAIPTRKAAALLVYLACNPRPHQREALADLLWDDLSSERALGNLRLSLNQLGKPFAPFLVCTRRTIALRSDAAIWLDTTALEQALDATAADIREPAGTLELYHGDFLQGFHLRDARGFNDWQHNQASHWRQLALKGMAALVDHYARRSSYAAGIAWARRMLTLDPSDEDVHRQIMHMLARSGQRHAAVRQYHDCRAILDEELGMEPEPTTELLFQRIQSMPTQRPYSLPPQNATLIGRVAELAHLHEWLATPGQRLLTVLGPGGIGKTHLTGALAWEVALEYLGPCADGVFYTELAPGDKVEQLIEGEELISLVAHSLQLSLSARIPLIEQLVQHLRTKEMLLIVDNGELLGQTARRVLGSLIQQTDSLRVMVLSRERLQLREEHILELDGLAHPTLPSRGLTQAHEELAWINLPNYAAIQWFFSCAQRVDSEMKLEQLSRPDQLAIGRLCQLVHGLPLAIELAAPLLNVQSPSELLSSIAQNINILETTLVDMPERHRSMRAVFAYSWQLLTTPMRAALARLAIFPASFSAAAAESVAQVTLPILSALRDRSLIKLNKTSAETRYGLHPLLRSFALERLDLDLNEAVHVRSQHARFFAALAQQHEGLLRGPQSADLLLRLDQEFENLRTGWQRAVDMGDIDLLGQYSITLHDLCATRGWEIEGSQLFQFAAALVQARIDEHTLNETQIRAAVRVLSCSAELRYILGDMEAAERLFQTGQRLLASIAVEDSPELLFIYKQLALIAYSRGAYTQATSYLRLTLRISEEEGPSALQADTHLSLGAVALAQGEWLAAEQALQRGLALYQSNHHDWGIGHVLRFLGALALARNNQKTAYEHLRESLAIAQRIDNKIGTALALDQLGMAYLIDHQLAESSAALTQALDLFRELGVESGVGRSSCHLGRLAIAQGVYDQAHSYFHSAMSIAQRLQAPPLLIESLAGILHVCYSTTPDARAEATFRILSQSLYQHPACTAETRRYIAAFANQATAAVTETLPAAESWPLQQIYDRLTVSATIPLKEWAITQ